jgi:transposase InsO family protein
MGRPPSQCLAGFDQRVSDKIKSLRSTNPGWGPKTLSVELEKDRGLKRLKLPKPSTIALFLKEKGLVKDYEKNVEMPGSAVHPAERPHQIWQIDGQGAAQIEKLGRINYLNVKDKYSKVYCGCLPVWSRSHNGSPSADDYRCVLRLAFREFGLPEKIQSDHATAFYENRSKSPFPTRFHLWLIALGIGLVFSRKRRPTDQACVERMHQTMEKQITTSTPPASLEMLSRRADQRRNRLNRDIPSSATGGLPPLVACPQARHSGKKYRPELEQGLIKLERVYDFLADGKWYRKVGCQGRVVSLGGEKYYLTNAISCSTLQITFDRQEKQLVFSDAKGENEIARKPITGIDYDNLMGEGFAQACLPGFQLQLPLSWETKKLALLF